MKIYRQKFRETIDSPYINFWGAWHKHGDRWATLFITIPEGADEATEEALKQKLIDEWPDSFEALLAKDK